MGESGAAAEGDASEASTTDGIKIVNVSEGGDIILDVTFETSQDTLKRARKAALAAARKAGSRDAHGDSTTATSTLKPKVRVPYRVSLEVLKKNSQYFANLLSNVQFHEAKIITAALGKLSLRNVNPAEADARDLPWITVTDDDEATQVAGREYAFEDMLRIIHQRPPRTSAVSMSHVVTLAIIADRFDCVATVARSLNSELKFKWPATSTRPFYDDSGRETDVEQTLRQKVLVAWLLGQAMRLHQASRELILRGSRLWSTVHEVDSDLTAAWWHLPDGLEHELQYRRECILNTIASVQRHFLNLYSSRDRQCKLGYDSSPACDSFQLGQMLRFLMSKNLLSLVDYSPHSLETIHDASTLDVEDVISTLKQCPNYQIDKHHTNCGLRIRIDPILDYIKAMLSANVVSINHATWKKSREDVSWALHGQTRAKDDNSRHFSFTRSMANDQRLRYEGAIHANQMARTLFTAESWDWTPEA